jgi:PKD repeat protein
MQSCFSRVYVRFENLSEGADDFQWIFGNGLLSKETDPEITYNDYGDYNIYLIATNLYNCADTSEMVYHVYHNPVADFTTDTTIGCDPFIVPFSNLSEYGLEYRWNFDDQGTSNEEEPVYTFNGQGVYTVSLTVTGMGGCKDSITKEDYITTNPSPVSDFSFTRTREIDTIYFNNLSSGAISYVWDFGDGQSSDKEEPWHKYLYYGTYDVSLVTINEYNCRDTMFNTIDFKLYKGLFLPNAFSPNNPSAKVREFKAVGIGLIKFHLLVYDNWGNLLWETEKLENGIPVEAWDGTFKGKPLSPDVYVWYLKEAVFKDGTSYDGKRYGTITLIK